MRIALLGRTEILYETAELLRKNGHEIALIITAKEALEYLKTSADFKKLAGNFGVPFMHTPRIEDAIDLIRSCGNIDIGVSMNYTGIIPKSVIELFPLGILNAHGGDLPRYRGNACSAWAILNGEDHITLCIHRMVGGELDTGDIIIRDNFPIDLDTKITVIWQWFSLRIPSMFSEALECLQKDPKYIMAAQSNDPKDALRCYPRRPEDGRIDWNKPAENILRLINASNKPYAGAFCEFEGQKLIIWDAEIAPFENFLGIPGQITMISGDFVEVATKTGKIRLKEVEYNGEIVSPSKLISSVRQRFC